MALSSVGKKIVYEDEYFSKTTGFVRKAVSGSESVIMVHNHQ